MRARFHCTWTVLAVCGVLAVGLSGCSSEEEAQRVLLIPRVNSLDMDFMLTDEVGVMVNLLEEAGVETVVALPDGQALQGETMTLEADLALADVVVADYDGFLLPCMGAGGERNDDTVEIVRQAVAAGLPVAAQFGSVGMLAEAGALDGREYAADGAFGSRAVEEGTYAGTGVVADGNVITSGTCPRAARYYDRPDGTADLTQAFIDALS
ncbi:MAG: DJ-1/PfpI family protein [Acidimicrobiia bacterium]|nr:DJ-1/PfpI family protein [Acidimicrobiia bacterium]